MRNDKLALLRGSLIQAREVRTQATDALMEAVGISTVEWDSFRQREFWTAEDARQCVITLSKAMALGFQMTGVPRIGVIAEHVASTIQVFVGPANWPVICSAGAAGLDGTRLLSSDGDEITSHETVSGERLYALVLAANELSAIVFRQIEDGEEA